MHAHLQTFEQQNKTFSILLRANPRIIHGTAYPGTDLRISCTSYFCEWRSRVCPSGSFKFRWRHTELNCDLHGSQTIFRE